MATQGAKLTPFQERLAFFIVIRRQSGLWRALKWFFYPCSIFGHKPIKVADYPHLDVPATGAKEIHQCQRCRKTIIHEAA